MRTWRAIFLGFGLLTVLGTWAEAQDAPRDFFTEPILVLNAGGHHAPVKAMQFATTSGSQLLTGGMDKVIHVWNLDVDRSGPVRTLRLPNWRGYRGQINALALSPRDDGGNQRLLAVAGYGVLGDLGEILLVRYPGPTGQGTGDIEGQLCAIPSLAGAPAQPGHKDVVQAIAFTPDGNFLASASNDKTVRIWDVATRRSVAVLAEAQAEVNTLGIFARGTRLVAGGSDGVLRLYDITNKAKPIFIAQYSPPGQAVPFLLGFKILKVAVSPDDRWIVVGTEGNRLLRFDANLQDERTFKTPEDPLTGQILALAISPDGNRLATSTVSKKLVAQVDFPTVSCVVQIRSMPDGRILETESPVENLVHAVAFSPDNRRLVYSGGDAQAVFVKELVPNAPPRDEIKGQGASLWDVGFRTDGRAVRFARSKPAVAGQAAAYEYFDLRGRFFFNPAADEPAYRHAQATEAGWTIRPFDQFQFDFTNAQGQGWRRTLDPANERRWWAYTVIPPGPGHPQPVAAVAADAGIVLWNLITGEKTRFFNGHAGPVYTLASSSDGKWLVSGSSDQTVRIWSLDGSDRVPAFGARFERRPNGPWVVSDVTPGGFADKMAMKKGLVIDHFYVGDYGPAVEYNLGDFVNRLDVETPTKMFSFVGKMPGVAEPFQAGITKRNSPVLSLFPAIDRRWVLWTPLGQYDSSADGDRRFLGWQTNRGTAGGLLAGSYDSIDKFEQRFRQPKAPAPNAIDRLLDPANPNQGAVIVVPPNAPDPTTSRLAILAISPAILAPTDRPIPVNQPTLQVNYRTLAMAGAAGIRRIWVEVNGRKLPDLINVAANAPALRQAQGVQDVPIGNDRDVLANLVVLDEAGVRRVESLEISNAAPLRPTSRKSKLEIIAIGTDQFSDKRLPGIPYAESDAKDLAPFLADRIVDPATNARFAPDQVNVRAYLGSQVTGLNLTAAFDDLKKSALTEGDVVLVVIESHYLELRSQKLLATPEPDETGPLPASLSASDLAVRLGEFTKLGSRVIVLVDAVHEIKEPTWENDVQEWVRQLQSPSNAIAFIASDHVPSSPLGEGHRVFAQEVLDVLLPRSAGRLRKPSKTMSLFDFQRTVVDNVLQKTGRTQHAQCYVPDTISIQVPFLDATPIKR